MSEPATFHWAQGKVRLIAALTAVIAALGIFLLFEDDTGAKLLGSAWIAALMWLAISLLRRARNNSPVVTVDQNGIFDRRISDRIIPWTEIAEIGTMQAESLTVVSIDLKPEASAFAHLNALHRLMRRPSKLFGYPSLAITMHTLDGTNDDVLAAIRRFRPDLIKNGGAP